MTLINSLKNLAFGALSLGDAGHAVLMPKGTLALPLNRIVNQTAYGVEMRVGTPPQSMNVLVDTGSSQIGLQGTNSNWCGLSYEPCSTYGSYDNSTSSTSKYKRNGFYNDLINHGYGDYISDTLRIGGRTFPHVVVGMILDYEASYPAPNPSSGIMGMAPFCTNADCSTNLTTTLQQKLIRQGELERNVLSVYLGPEEQDAEGSMLFGAVDRAKQMGKVVTMPITSPTGNLENFSLNIVRFNSMSLERKSVAGRNSRRSNAGKKVTTKKFKVSKGAYTLLDTGFPGFRLPQEAWNAVSSYFDLNERTDPQTGSHRVDCKFRKQQADDATLIVGFADDDLLIRIPLSRLVTQLGPHHCVTFAENCGNRGKGCSFGDAFMRSTYTTFDFDNHSLSMSNVRYTDDTDIVAV